MKPLFIIPLVLMSLVSFPSWGLTMDDLVQRDGLYYEKFTDVPFTGKINEGTMQGNVSNGRQEGSWTFYDQNGQLWTRGNFRSGKMEGPSVEYFEDGKISSEGDYSNDRRSGAWVGYHPNGQLNFKGSFKNGKMEGLWIRYWELGNLMSKGSYKNGEMDGRWVWFGIDGSVSENRTGKFVNGVKVSD